MSTNDMLRQILRRLRSNTAAQRVDPEIESHCKAVGPYFDKAYYLETYEDVAAVQVDPIIHFCTHGWRENRNPNKSFSTRKYIENSKTYRPELGNPFIHHLKELEANNESYRELHEPDWLRFSFTGSLLGGGSNGAEATYFAAFPKNRKADIELVLANMDTEFYLKEYPEVLESGLNPAVHYLSLGWVKGYDPSPDFSSSYYLEYNKDIRESGANPFLHYLSHADKQNWRRSADRMTARTLKRFERSALLSKAVEDALVLDPMIALPDLPRKVTSPNVNAEALKVAKHLRQRFAGKTFSQIVLIPHVRLSGAAKISGLYSKAVVNLFGAEKTLIVMCDLDVFERPEWFPADAQFLNLTQLTAGISDQSAKMDILYDLFRGVQAQKISNVNSRLCWDMFRQYGKQMSQEFDLQCYLFCWEETKRGARVGYPIQWLHDTVSYMTTIFCDSQFLANHVEETFLLSNSTSQHVVPALTPIDYKDVAPAEGGQGAENMEIKTVGSVHSPFRKKILWSGRFDHQKRLDVLFAIASSNPNWEFFVYGKPVIRDQDVLNVVDKLKALENVKMMGVYAAVHDVTAYECEVFLYTSQYDGIPTVLLEMGLLGFPIVAPDVGGVSELVDNTTGWLIEDCNDVEAYERAIKEVVPENPEVANRVAALKSRIEENHSYALYSQTIGDALAKEEKA